MPVLCLAGAIMIYILSCPHWVVNWHGAFHAIYTSIDGKLFHLYSCRLWYTLYTLSPCFSRSAHTHSEAQHFWTTRKTGDISSMWEQGSLTTMTLIMEPSLRTSMRGIRQRCKHTGDSTSISHKVGWECDKHNIKMASQVQLILRSTVP